MPFPPFIYRTDHVPHQYLLLLLFLLLLLLMAVQSLVDVSLFQNCPSLYSVLLLTSPVPQAHVL